MKWVTEGRAVAQQSQTEQLLLKSRKLNANVGILQQERMPKSEQINFIV